VVKPMEILILSPHTDDAELGCGGSIVKFLDEGHKIYWAVFSTAEESLPEGMPKDSLKKEFCSVIDNLGMSLESCLVYNFKVRSLHQHRQEILEELVKMKANFDPDMVIGPSVNDLHQDHQVIANEMIRAFKTSSSIICYELPWNHISFMTQLFIKLKKDHVAKKCDILKEYRSQLMKDKLYFSRQFIYGLARTRGVQCNTRYAEAFEVVRWMI
jgi:LmbE family N-acetylglucosaminyl deacetylase